MSPAKGHEGWFSPDGMTYYMSTDRQQTATTPSSPSTSATRASRSCSPPGRSRPRRNGGFTTEDGRTSFICQQQAPPFDALLLVDTSQVAERRPSPKPTLFNRVGLQDNQWCQSALRVTYGGHPFLIQYGERSGQNACNSVEFNWANFGYPRIYDLRRRAEPAAGGDPRLLQSALPEHCQRGGRRGRDQRPGLQRPPLLGGPALRTPRSWRATGSSPACGVLDIRDPYHPVELGYYNPGVNAVVGTGARPVVRAERKEIWFVNDSGASTFVRFEDGLWPFPGSALPRVSTTTTTRTTTLARRCPTANFNGIGKPARRRGAANGGAGRAPADAPLAAARPPRAAALHGVSPWRVTIDVRRGGPARVSGGSFRVRAGPRERPPAPAAPGPLRRRRPGGRRACARPPPARRAVSRLRPDVGVGTC
jgi:hypothetical protein